MTDATRHDGRRPDELRPISFDVGYLEHAEGSCLVSFGKTRVLCAATLESDAPRWLRGKGRGWVTAEYSMLPRSTVERTPREVTRGRPSGRTQEIQRLIGRSLRAVVDLEALPECSLVVDCDCLVADGGTRTAAITGGFVALADAFRRLVEEGRLERDPVRDHVAAVSVGLVSGTTCLDLDYAEDAAAEVDMNVVMTGEGRFCEVQGTAEGDPFDRAVLDGMLELAGRAVEELVAAQRTVLGG